MSAAAAFGKKEQIIYVRTMKCLSITSNKLMIVSVFGSNHLVRFSKRYYIFTLLMNLLNWHQMHYETFELWLCILLLGKDDLYNSKNQIFYIVHSVWSVTLHFEKLRKFLFFFTVLQLSTWFEKCLHTYLFYTKIVHDHAHNDGHLVRC